jgi:hypothetical protein
MIPVEQELPSTKTFTSKAVLFMVDGVRYAGHYHDNGWFYCDEQFGHEHGKQVVGMAAGPLARRDNFSGKVPEAKVTEWEYV